MKCASEKGLLTYGSGTWGSVDWTPFDLIGVDYYLDDRRVRGDLVRDESVQADTIERLSDVYEAEDVHAAFLCMFVEGDCRSLPRPHP